MGASNFSVYTSFKAKDGVSPVLKNMKLGATKFEGQLNKIALTSKNFQKSVSGSFDKVKGAVAGLVAFMAANTIKNTLDSWVGAASDLQETIGKTEVSFKSNAQEVLKWSETSIKNMGLAQQTALDTASLYGDMGTGMGMSTKRASEMSMMLTQLSADLSSYKNISQDISKNALKGIFTGETEALKNLGTVMTQENLQAFAEAQGYAKKLKDMTQNEKIELRYAFVMDSQKNALGDFLRTGGNFANQKRKLEQTILELNTKLGQILLPRYNEIAKAMNEALGKYMPSIEHAFSTVFKAVEKGLKICSPVFSAFNDIIKYLAKNLMPEVKKYLPVIQTLLERAVVPTVLLVLNGIKALLETINFGYNLLKNTFNFVKENWLPLLLTLPIAIVGVKAAITGVQMATDILRLKMALLKMEGGALSLVMNTKVVKCLTAFTSSIWKSVPALLAQAAAFAMSPIGLITMGVLALVGVTILLWKNWDKVTATVSKWWTSTKEVLVGFWGQCKSVFGSIGQFIKEHFIDILLTALGPVGAIINAIRRMPELLKVLGFKGDAFKIETKNGGENPTDTPKPNGGGKDGVIRVETTLNNNTNLEAKTSTSLQSPNNLQLKPA